MMLNFSKNLLLPACFQEWLCYAGSFMQRLKTHGVDDAAIHVLQEEWQSPDSDEKTLLGVEQDDVWVREVLIASGEKIWMFARTVVPRQVLTEQYQQLATLENRPLGSILFNDPDVKRGEFEFACLKADSAWQTKILQWAERSDFSIELWARRSLFFLPENALLLTEVFFPEIASL